MKSKFNKKSALRSFRGILNKVVDLIESHCGRDLEVHEAWDAFLALEVFFSGQLEEAFQAGKNQSSKP